MPFNELSGKRPSRLSGVFRDAYQRGPLRDWTRHIDGDWLWYCPKCKAFVLICEEKEANAAATSWEQTRLLALGHKDKPHAWRVTCHADGWFAVEGVTGDDRQYSFQAQAADLFAKIAELFIRHGCLSPPTALWKQAGALKPACVSCGVGCAPHQRNVDGTFLCDRCAGARQPA